VIPRGDIPFEPAREESELRDYLGSDYDRRRLTRYQETLAEEVAGCDDEQLLYRTSRAYLYNLTAFAMTGTKLPYLRTLVSLVPPAARLLDYGCGIGSDGLMLLEAGYRVEFADFDNPSTAYLRWRLRERGLEAPVHDLDRGVPGGFDAAYAFDVIEHVPDPFAFLAAMEERSRLVVVNLLEAEPDDQEIHHALPIGAILDRAARSRLRYYRVHHTRSHLVAYEPGEAATGARALANRARIRVAALRSRGARMRAASRRRLRQPR
jgi:SAM-dependent methyltransferase